ncbi:MAG: translation initiation factor Sui1 [Ramlibacter sp.]
MGSPQPRPAPGGLVYSTEAGRMCPGCRQPIAQCTCATAVGTSASTDGIVRISRETKGRGGKAVTCVRGLALDAVALDKLARQLKAVCGSGGTVKDGVVELQGDHADKVLALLQTQGHKVKRAGG